MRDKQPLCRVKCCATSAHDDVAAGKVEERSIVRITHYTTARIGEGTSCLVHNCTNEISPRTLI